MASRRITWGIPVMVSHPGVTRLHDTAIPDTLPARAKCFQINCLRKLWLGRQDSNLGMAESKSAALPLGYAPNTGGPPFNRFGASQQQGNRGLMTRCGARVTRRSRKFAQLEFFDARALALSAREFYTGASLVIGV